jgi:hypothetical protein
MSIRFGNRMLRRTAKPPPKVAHRACLSRPSIVTDKLARRSPLLFRQKNATLKSFEEMMEVLKRGAFLATIHGGDGGPLTSKG